MTSLITARQRPVLAVGETAQFTCMGVKLDFLTGQLHLCLHQSITFITNACAGKARRWRGFAAKAKETRPETLPACAYASTRHQAEWKCLVLVSAQSSTRITGSSRCTLRRGAPGRLFAAGARAVGTTAEGEPCMPCFCALRATLERSRRRKDWRSSNVLEWQLAGHVRGPLSCLSGAVCCKSTGFQTHSCSRSLLRCPLSAASAGVISPGQIYTNPNGSKAVVSRLGQGARQQVGEARIHEPVRFSRATMSDRRG